MFALAIAMVLLCFYLRKIKRAPRDVTTPTTQDGNTSAVLHTISLPEDQAEDRHDDRFPPRYSTVDHPPPYSLVSEPSQPATVTGSMHTDLNYLLFVNTPNISYQSHQWYFD